MDAMIDLLVLLLWLSGLYSVLGLLAWGLEQLPTLASGRRHRLRQRAQRAPRPPRRPIADVLPLVPTRPIVLGIGAAVRRLHET